MKRILGGIFCFSLFAGAALGVDVPVNVPNFSFEMPPVVRDEQNPFGALPYIDDWDETALGDFDEFDQNTGNFLNTEPESPDHVTNSHVDRMAFISSLIGNDLRQAIGEDFSPGWSYELKVAIGKSSTFPVGNTEALEVALFYFNGGSEQIIASTTIMGSQVGTTSLLDVTVSLGTVQINDAWAGEPIGVLVRPATDDPDEKDGEGFWNLDHVRLVKSNPLVPATSTWGLVALSLLTAVAGTLALGRQAAPML